MAANSSNNTGFYRRTVNDIRHISHRITSSRLHRAGMVGLKYDVGMGSEGLFQRNTLAIGGHTGGLHGLGSAFKHASGGQRARLAGRVALRALGPGFTVYTAAQGYREGGLMGAGRNLAIHGAFSYAFGAGIQAASAIGGAALTLAGPLAVAYGTYKAMEQGNARIKKSRRIEMGSPIVDPWGTAATMRQRSMQALQFSQFNGRSVFGQEGSLLHIPMMR